MYKLTILFFFLTAFNSQGLMDQYQLKFANENATYTLEIKEGSLVMENQPDVTVTAIAENNPDTDKAPFDAAQGRVYKITKGATFEEGLKIGEVDEIDAGFKEIGESDEIDAGFKEIGASDEIDAGFKEIGASDDIDAGFKEIGAVDDIDAGFKEIGTLFGIGNHQACEIVLGYELLTVVEKYNNKKTMFAIPEKGVYLIISDDKFGLLR